MNTDSIDNDSISIEESSDEGNFTLNIQKKTSRCLKYRFSAGVCAFLIFTCFSMTVGVLTIYLTSPKPTNGTCRLTFKGTAQPETGYNSRPRHAVVGDFNGDNDLDIVVANSGTDEVGIFLGYGDGSFADQIPYSTGLGSRPYAVAVGHFNKDNQLDIVAAHFGTNSIGVLFGDGNGSFASQIITSLGSSSPLSLAVGDFNNDNQLDIVVANYGTLNVAILLGNNDGSFRIGTIYDMSYDSIPYSVAVADFNEDNKLDIAIVNYGTSNLVILVTNENGTFISHEYSTGNGSHPCSIAVGDFNNDNILDIAVTNSGTNNVGIFLGNGNGSFTNIMIQSIGSNSNPRFIVVGDFNKDNKLDIIVANSANDNVLVLKGDGNGTFFIATTHSTGYKSDPCSIAVGDFDNDNIPDVAITNNDTNTILVLTTYVVYPIVIPATFSTGTNSTPNSVVVGDFNNDNHLDIVVADYKSNNIGVFMGFGNGTFGNQTAFSTGKNSQPCSVAVGDFDEDNQLDIVFVMKGISEVGILLGYGNGTFEYGDSYSTGNNSSPTWITVGDFNNDNNLDVVTADYNTGDVCILFGVGDGTFTNITTVSIGIDSFPVSVAVGDFNSDNITDIVTSNFDSSSIAILLGYGNGSFRNPLIISTNKDLPNFVTIGDLNNDHRLDIVYTSPLVSNIGILLGYGNGTFENIIRYSTGRKSFPWSLVLIDFNNDTLLDIAVANVYDFNIGVLYGYGNGSFSAQKTFSTGFGSSVKSMAFGDFNNDKQMDIVYGDSDNDNIGVFLVESQADFASETSYFTGSGPHPYSIAIGDFNNDRQSDIVVANPGNDDIQILIGYNKGTFMSNLTYSTGSGSYPQSVTVADFNRDNQLDIAVANNRNGNINLFYGFGNGTFDAPSAYSTGSNSFPSSICVGDFNNDSWMDIAVSNQNSNTVSVFVSFDYATFTNQTIYVSGLIPTPSYVAVGDFNNDYHWDIAVANTGADNIGIYLGYGNGTFSKQISYSTGSSSSPISLAVGYFNDDKQLDIVVVSSINNNIGILLGYGNGSFQTQMTYSTGESSSPSSVAVGDFNNDNIVDIAVANSASNNIGVFIGYGNGTFGQQITYSLVKNSSPAWIIIDDLNNDNIPDIAVANNDRNSISILFGYGNGTFRNLISYSTGSNSGPSSIATGDFNRDNRTDIVVVNQNASNIDIFFGRGNGTFLTPITYYNFGSALISVAVGDVNNDGMLDILLTSWYQNGDMILILFGFGNGEFTIPTAYSIGLNAQPTSIAICDFNNDSRMDLAISNSNKDNILILFQYSSERFITPWLFSTGNDSDPRSVAVGNFNNDHYLDIAVANSGTNNIGILLGQGDGTFEVQQTYSTGNNSGPVSIVVGYINNDNQLDIVVANSATDNIAILLGSPNGTFVILTTYSTGIDSNPSSIAISDINKDNYLDIVVTTFGTNEVLVFVGFGNGTFVEPKSYSVGYNADPESVAIGDINNDGLLDIVVANSGSDYVEILLQTC